MNTHVPEEHSLSRDKNSESRVMYVEELADNVQDAWVSITDAARITRTSEAMARRWVSSGRLPVKRLPVGINQHTRLVRLSDVAAIRPIIDPTAAISDEVHMLDLPSIPRQQAQIMQNHEHLLQQVLEGDTHIKDLSVQVHTQTQALEQVKHTQIEHERKFQDDLERHRVMFADQLQRAEATMQVREETFAQLHQNWQHQMEEVHHDLVSMQQQQNEQVHTVLENLGDTISNQQQELKHLQQDLTEQHQNVVRYHEEAVHLVEQQIQEVKAVFEQAAAEQSRQIMLLLEKMEKRENHVERVVRGVQEVHTVVQDCLRRLTLQDRRIQELTKSLQAETQARKKNTLDVLVLQKHLQILQREMESMKRRKGES